MRSALLLLLFFTLSAGANDSARLYNPSANVKKDMEEVILRARKENKHVLIQVGGNWCTWCYRLNSFLNSDPILKKLVSDNYVVYHLNYSKENKNLEYLKKLGDPQRFGFPALIVLDKIGNRIHTQDGGLLKKGNGYDTNKVRAFLQRWAPCAFEKALYNE